ncbi:23S rRNA (pseudouridine(1915)-N(3))-methyltransferase RlmH [Zavarzinia sp. CC-PAN008]|uniref:23S rRNA (pseudouridine(1915)-N(3))-methyltransferase RlmH n=1 Tax=Zavarzinia sp. CC-PAN008 TaxID=3243332 RepID=UPI003F7456D9
MKLLVVAVGKARRGAEQALHDDYARRLAWPLRLVELPDARAPTSDERKRKEGRAILDAVGTTTLVALDPRGTALSSEALAERIGRWRDEGTGELAFVIGGPDGLDEAVRSKAALTLSFGPATWPHLLVRAMLAEQLYRAQTILSGHPYHRA